jgi:hypothetical protein
MNFLNQYTRRMIYDITGKEIKEPTVVCVGNTMARIKLKKSFGSTINIIGPAHCGRLTACLELADQLDLRVCIDYTGKEQLKDFEAMNIIIHDSPTILIDHAIYISTTLLTKWKLIPIKFTSLSQHDREEFKALKGYDIPIQPHNPSVPISLQMEQFITHESDEMPDQAERWIMHNLYNIPNISAICLLAAQQKDDYWKKAALQLIKLKSPPPLKYPITVKYK